MVDSDLDEISRTSSFDGDEDVPFHDDEYDNRVPDTDSVASISTSDTNYDDDGVYLDEYFAEDNEKQMIGTYELKTFDNIHLEHVHKLDLLVA